MKRKIAATAVLLGISMMMWIGIASADEVELYVRTDKAYYGYGEAGTLHVTVWNRGGAVDLKDIKVNFPWEGLYHDAWGGNLTHEINEALGKDNKATYELTFTIPSESRDVWAGTMGEAATVTLNYEMGGGPESETKFIPINVEIPVSNQNITPIYYLTAVLATAVIIVIIELYFVWRRLSRLTAATAAP